MNGISKFKGARKSATRGFTLLELMGVLVLISVALFFVIRQQHAATVRSDADAITRSATFVVQNAPNVYKPTFTGLNCANLANNGAFTGTTFRVDRTAGIHIYYNDDPSSEITCAAVNLFGTADAYTLTFPGSTNDLCSELADKIDQLAWVMTIDGTPVKPARGVLDVATKGTQCTNAGTSDNHAIVVTLARTSPPQ